MEWAEFRTQKHLMDAEFSDSNEIKEFEIKEIALKRGYDVSNIHIWYDTMMSFWRGCADIKKLRGQDD